MLPWGQIISAGFTIADVARGIYNSTKKNKEKGGTIELHQRVELLETTQLKQAELITQMAEQNKLLVKQVRGYFILTIFALIISLICVGVLVLFVLGV